MYPSKFGCHWSLTIRLQQRFFGGGGLKNQLNKIAIGVNSTYLVSDNSGEIAPQEMYDEVVAHDLAHGKQHVHLKTNGSTFNVSVY